MIGAYDTPCGRLWVSGDRDTVSRVSWEIIEGTAHQGDLDWILFSLDRYFSREVEFFEGTLSFEGTEPKWKRRGDPVPPITLAQRALHAISCIPFGHPATYGEIAGAIGNPRLARFVGQICKHNPLALIVPCHRVVARGSLGGYSPCLFRKEILLKHEGVDTGSI